MARVKISELRTKHLLYSSMGGDYEGLEIDLSKTYRQQVAAFFINRKKAVVKVDQAIKKRNKLGLVKIGTQTELLQALREYKSLGYRWALIEPYIEHDITEERFIAFELIDAGVRVLYSPKGGVSVEESGGELSNYVVQEGVVPKGLAESGVPERFVRQVVALLEKQHITNLEINPLVVRGDGCLILDAACQVDGAAEFFVDGWTLEKDQRSANRARHYIEDTVEALAAKSPASLTLRVLNDDAKIFLLLSGGGASVVILDELAESGLINAVANYGEYSGNPNRQETYLYTKAILELMKLSQGKPKVILIAGGVANFTDVAKTFDGIIDAFKEELDFLIREKVLVVVRRGGPNEKAGLAHMMNFLELNKIANSVHGAEASITRAVSEVESYVGGDDD